MNNYLEIKKRFEQRADEKNAVKMARYMRNLFKFYGIATPGRKACYRNFLRDEKKGKCVDWSFLEECYEDEYREFQYAAVDYLAAMQESLTFDDVPRIEKFIRSKQWWDTIDGLDRIVGNIGLDDERINGLMLGWSRDEDFWVRRVAIDHQLCRKEKTNTKLLEQIIVNNFGSSEFFINKAIGWSLRDYSKTNPEWVRGFLDKYRDKMHKLSVTEAEKYI